MDRQLRFEEYLADDLGNIGLAYLSLADREAAAKVFTEARAIFEKLRRQDMVKEINEIMSENRGVNILYEYFEVTIVQIVTFRCLELPKFQFDTSG